MSRPPNAMTTADLRDHEAEDRDEAAWRRDQASSGRDRDAQERDLRAEDKMQAALHCAQVVRDMLDVSSQRDDQAPIAEQTAALRNLLARFSEALQVAEADRLAARRDRQAAAGDRLLAAGDRDIQAAHRGQAAIERAQHLHIGDADRGGGAEMLVAAQAACARSEALRQRGNASDSGLPARGDMLRGPLVARLQARLDTMPVIEQAKGIIMAQRRCGEDEALDLLRQASQRLNQPIRNVAARLVTSNAATGGDGTGGQRPG
jgi:hypothetical protein